MRQSWQNKIPLKTTRPNKRKLKLEVARKALHKPIVIEAKDDCKQKANKAREVMGRAAKMALNKKPIAREKMWEKHYKA